jgi:NAD(P)H dehydrogenase (quinone)
VQAQNAELSAEVPPATADDIVWADAVLFGSPTPLAEVVARLRGNGMG